MRAVKVAHFAVTTTKKAMRTYIKVRSDHDRLPNIAEQ